MSRIRRAGAALLVVAPVAALAPDAALDHAGHAERRGQIHRAQRDHAAIVRDVVELRGAVRFDFDALVEHRRDLAQALAGLSERLDAEEGDPELGAALARVQAAVAAEAARIERFKSHLAIARNSALYVPRLLEEVSGAAAALTPALLAGLGQLQAELLRLRELATDDIRARIREHSAALAAHAGPAAPRPLTLLLRHIDLLLTHQREASAELDAIVRGDVTSALDGLARRLDESYEAEAARALRARVLLTLAALALVGLITLGHARARPP